MSIVVLILELIPVAADFIKWLVDLLNKHAPEVQPTGDDAADARTLLTLVEADPALFLHPLRRAVVVYLTFKAPAAIAAGKPLSDADREALAALLARTE